MTTRFHIEGSVLAETPASRSLDFDIRVEIDSPEPRERIARMLFTAERSWYLVQSLLRPVTVNHDFALNGGEIELERE